MNENSDLLLQLKEGSYAAFNRIYEQYFDLLYGFIFRLTRSHARTKELVQETFIRVWIHRESIDPEQPFKAWLYAIARNLLRDQLRKQFNDPVFEDYLIHCSNEKLTVQWQDADPFDLEAFRLALTKAKKKLTPRQLEIFESCKEKGMAPAEVATKLNLSEQSVYNYLHQALTILRKELSSSYLFFFLFFLSK